MGRTPRTWLALLAFLALTLWTLPAAADPDDDHPGRYTPSPESTSANMHLLGSAPKTTTDPTYRNSDLAFLGAAGLRRQLSGLPDHRHLRPRGARGAGRRHLPGAAA